MLMAWASPVAASQELEAEEQSAATQADVENDAQAQAQVDGDSPYKLKVDATLVSVDVVVTDERGNVLGGLQGGNFRVLDDGKPQEILSFTSTSAPITVVLLLEYSAASYSYYAAKAAEWGSDFLNQLEPEDWVALVTFDIKPEVHVDFTRKRYEVRDALYTLGSPKFRDANLFDALIDTLDKLDKVRGRKSILVLSTGANTFSASTLDEVLARLKTANTTIFAVGLAEGESVRSIGSSISYMQGKSWLTEFAKRTGGFALFPRFEGELSDIFRTVTGYLRNEYTLTYRPPKEQRDGRYHRLKVDVIGQDGKPLKFTDEKGKRRKLVVHTRDGYMAPKDKGEGVVEQTGSAQGSAGMEMGR